MKLVCFLITLAVTFYTSFEEEVLPCSSNIYCYGKLLDAAQSANVYNDSKSFVDSKLRKEPEIVYFHFEQLLNKSDGFIDNVEMKKFVEDYFEAPGSEFVEWFPDDWIENPSFISKINDKSLKSWTKELNNLWKELGRKIVSDVEKNPSLYSIIPVPNAMVVPGGRFREYYYWDTYWVIKGLLLSEMYATVKGILENLLYLVKLYHFIPNGGRIYYTERSQPPFLISMILDYLQATGDVDFVKKNIDVLESEHDFWLRNRSVEVRGHMLNHYGTPMNQFRPESYREDKCQSQKLSDIDIPEWMSHVASACESGWDFSSRWSDPALHNNKNGDLYDNVLMSINTKNVIPVDLNSILARNERSLMHLYESWGDGEKSKKYGELYKKRVAAIEDVFWNSTDETYYDFILSTNRQNSAYYASNSNPLWTKVYPLEVDEKVRDRQIFEYLKKHGAFSYPGGIPTSLLHSDHQWDFPNAWPPLVHMIIEGLASSQDEVLKQEGFVQASKWVNTNYEAFKKTGAMFEKFDVRYKNGVAGGGGEYDVQKGFGWTNGVIMALLDKYGSDIKVNSGGPTNKASYKLMGPFIFTIFWTKLLNN